MKRIVILGSTGSIGRNTLEVIKSLGSDYQVRGLAARSSFELLARQARDFRAPLMAIPDTEKKNLILQQLGGFPIDLRCGPNALTELASDSQTEVVVNALVGGAGLKALLAALTAGKILALANKESIVMAGPPGDGHGSTTQRYSNSGRQ